MFQPWIPALRPQQPHVYHPYVDRRSSDEYEANQMTTVTGEDEKSALGQTEAILVVTEMESKEEGGTGEAENQRNERERRRVQQVNAAFALLRQHLPIQSGTYETADWTRRVTTRKRRSQRTSKVKILRAAIRYINELAEILKAPEVVESELFVW
ncbi:unnamed protein product [Hydatigera taeniaeformis]|uniref:BHLH domain-containing protein n=1 Tax=Hydatigena taeniaeformis TaxID=6205 RepID=A0A0R3WHL6_HYDTA|nr:unnamed protein product [Hydatigera taeniaeformis]